MRTSALTRPGWPSVARSDSQLDTTPSKLVADVADSEELAEVEATVSRVVRGLRGCSRGCGAAGAECLLLLRAVPRSARWPLAAAGLSAASLDRR